MQEIFTPERAQNEYRRTRERPMPRPDRFAFWAVVMAVTAMIAGVASSDASDGGIGTTDGSGSASTREARYFSIWERTAPRQKRWARRTSECESGRDPNAIGGGGRYRGAFQFMPRTWRDAPRSPGGDPIDYRWKTQAVVAVALKRKDGAGHWPVCG